MRLLIHNCRPDIIVECLTPDFRGDMAAVRHLAASGLDVFAHNIETVHSLQVRPLAFFPPILPPAKGAVDMQVDLIWRSSEQLFFGKLLFPKLLRQAPPPPQAAVFRMTARCLSEWRHYMRRRLPTANAWTHCSLRQCPPVMGRMCSEKGAQSCR